MNSPVAFRLLFITDEYDGETAQRVASALAALPAGAAAVQLRAHTLDGAALLAAARVLVEIARPFGAPVLVNDRVDVALAAGAAGVHLPARGLPAKSARRVAPSLLVGASTHSLAEARMAAAGGAHYVTFGPVFPTASKAAFGPPVGMDALAEAVAALPVPVFALGGLDGARARACAAVGARAASIGAVLGAADPAAGARALWEALG